MGALPHRANSHGPPGVPRRSLGSSGRLKRCAEKNGFLQFSLGEAQDLEEWKYYDIHRSPRIYYVDQ